MNEILNLIINDLNGQWILLKRYSLWVAPPIVLHSILMHKYNINEDGSGFSFFGYFINKFIRKLK